MLLFLPLVILALSLLALAFSNLQRGFRSNWLLAIGGVSLSVLSLLFLRFQLPLSHTFSFWWIGEGLEYPATFILDDVSWSLAFVISSLLLAALLGEVRHAVTATWLSWAPGFVAAAATMLAVIAGDTLTLVFAWTLLDITILVLLIPHLEEQGNRKAALEDFILKLFSTFLLLAAWILSFYGSGLNAALLLLAATLRLGVWTPLLALHPPKELRGDLGVMLALAPLAATLPVLARSDGLIEPARSLLLVLIFLPAAWTAGTWLLRPTEEEDGHAWHLGLAALAAASALVGQGQAALAFGLLLLMGRTLLPLVQQSARWRVVLAVAATALLAGFPFTASAWASGLYVTPTFLAYIFLLVQTTMLAGWLRRAVDAKPTPPQPEPWMQTTQRLANWLIPVAYVFFGLGLLPSFATEETVAPWWPALTVAAGSWGLFLFTRKRQIEFPLPLSKPVAGVLSLSWLQKVLFFLVDGTTRGLAFLNALLEGKAGVLWTILTMALLISVAFQSIMGN